MSWGALGWLVIAARMSSDIVTTSFPGPRFRPQEKKPLKARKSLKWAPTYQGSSVNFSIEMKPFRRRIHVA